MAKHIFTSMDTRPTDTRLGPYLVDTVVATGALDEAIGALTLAYEVVCHEAGRNRMLAHVFCSMRLAIDRLEELRDTLSEAQSVEVSHG